MATQVKKPGYIGSAGSKANNPMENLPAGWSVTSSGDGMYNYEYTPQALLDLREQYKGDNEALARINAGVRSFSNRWSTFDELNSLFGGQSTADRLMQEMALDYDKYLTETRNFLENRDYNSELSQKTRMANAGMNSDLMGIGDAATAPEVGPDETLPNLQGAHAPGDNIVSNLTQISQGIFDVFSTAINFASQFQGLKMNQADFFQKQIDSIFGSSDNIIKDLAASWPDRFDFNGPREEDYDLSDPIKRQLFAREKANWKDMRAAWLYQWVANKRDLFPKSMRKRAMSLLLNATEDSGYLNRLIAENRAARVASDRESVEGMSDGVFDEDFYMMLSGFNKHFGDYQHTIYKLQKQNAAEGLSIEMIENAYNREYWDTLVKNHGGMTAAQAQILQNKAIKAAEAYNAAENTYWNNMLDGSPGGIFGQLVKAGVMMLRAQVSKGIVLPSVSSHSSFKNSAGGASWFRGQGSSENSSSGKSSGFSINW